jgi:hypothetical protein
MKIHHTVAGLLLTSLLVACGGGGGGGDSSPPVTVGPVISMLSFPFKSAYTAMVQSGYTKNYTVSGDCSGTAVDSWAPAVAATGAAASVFFPGASFAVQQTLQINVPNCPALSATATATGYYDSNYTPLGSETSATYRVYATTTTATTIASSIPSTVVVGVVGTMGTASDFNKSPFGQLGTTVVSYVVVPETASTAVVNLTYKSYDNANTLYKAQQDRYRIGMTGALVPLSIDFVQQTNTGTAHLLFQ